jgi:glutaredoxin 3
MTNVVIYSKPHCPYCDKAKALLERMNIEFEAKMLDKDFTREDLMEVAPRARTFPQVFINGTNIGGYDQLTTYIETTNFNGTGFTL